MIAQDLSPEELDSLPEEKKLLILDMGVECGRITEAQKEEYIKERKLSILVEAVYGSNNVSSN